ncbi:unnamed protein product [Tuber melanosporum]|uniref:(Perigord truffle) hypothetical protein n=1 Tax=Tuber melanosporum (strain Mel28) TaxID=656061 RepID=D5GPM7_TUBMM|nr:uncharacterized protein GSTUM_00011936001 [Tuber melanosporum]CAZ86470.1 unnamed protein product [Tuber melanosporum]
MTHGQRHNSPQNSPLVHLHYWEHDCVSKSMLLIVCYWRLTAEQNYKVQCWKTETLPRTVMLNSDAERQCSLP